MVAISTCLSACQISFPAHRAMFRPLTALEAKGVEVSQAARTSVVSLPGMTISVSNSYLSSAGKFRPVNKSANDAIWGLNSDSLLVQVLESGDCKPSHVAREIAHQGMLAVAEHGGKWPGRVIVSMRILGNGGPRARYGFSISSAKSARLAFEWRCVEAEDIWPLQMASTALHEAVHAVLDLSGKQPLSLTVAEEIAYGAEACFLLALERRNALTTMQALGLRAHLRDSIYADEADDFPGRCKIYQAYFAGIWR